MLAQRLKKLRNQQGISQYELADRLGTNQTQVMRWESGKVNPTGESITMIADYFDVTTDYLLGRTNEPHIEIGTSDLSDDEQQLIQLVRDGLLSDALVILAALSDPEKAK
ncbi:MAG: helix-turn-helix transcriptional regulator [Chloroflexota bacterium]